MRKIHVLTRKEEIDPQRITGCTAVIIDVLLATTTIAATLHHGANEVIPVMNDSEAHELAKALPKDSYLLSGEKEGYTLEGFLDPDPTALIGADLSGKTIILSTTNGTVAVRKSMTAKRVYTSSLLNGSAVARRIIQDEDESSVLVVCSGSHGRFALEDFLGAGYLVSELLRENRSSWSLTDSAKAAFLLYEDQSEVLGSALQKCETGLLLSGLGFNEAVAYAAQPSLLPVVPRLVENRLTITNE